MEITVEKSGEVKELKVKGRLDGYWADHLAGALDEEIRRGSHHLMLDLSEVVFLSSAGIRVLVKYYRQLREIQGSLVVSEASEPVKKVLEISRLTGVLLTGMRDMAAVGAPSLPTTATASAMAIHLEAHGTAFDVFPCTPKATLKLRLLGDPDLLRGCRFRRDSCSTVQFPESTFGIGLGALGDSFEECRGRFGEFIAVGGTVAYLPTDGTNVPDYLVAAGSSLPDVQVCYGLACDGQFSKLVRFEAKDEAGAVKLMQLVDSLLEISEAEQSGLVIVAESAGLIGASLRRSPTGEAAKNAPFEFPGIREWLSFTGEPAYTRSLALVAGVAARGVEGILTPLLQPLTSATPIVGHFHAAAFSYRPVQKGKIELRRTVKSLFENQTLLGVLHLLSDDRVFAGAGQSQFVRGACWLAPLAETIEERS